MVSTNGREKEVHLQPETGANWMTATRSTLILISIIAGTLLGAMSLTQNASAGAECASLGGACDDSGDWDPMAKLEEIGNTTATKEQAAANWPQKSREIRWHMNSSGEELEEDDKENVEASDSVQMAESEDARNSEIAAPAMMANKQINMTRSANAREMLLPLDEVKDGDILLDVSENVSIHIEGSIYIPYMEFYVQPGIQKSAAEIATILGEAGITPEDTVVIYGECLPCGGGPSVATYVYWMMKGLGHENLKVLDGTAEDWVASGRPTSQSARELLAREYNPQEVSNYTATYEMVKSGQVQIVDARTLPEYAMGTIPGSISIPYDSTLFEKRITGEDRLDMVFLILNKDQPVVVFTNTGMKGSVVWFALEMMGYDARLYTYMDWMTNPNQKHLEKNGSREMNDTAI